MIIIAAVDDNMGLMFNHRRLSQDHLLRKNILEMTDGHRLWMNQYSYKQFCQGDDGPQINVDDSFMHEAAQGDFAFIEDAPVKPHEKWIEKVVLYKWNRKYPSDQKLDIDLSGWRLISTEDFPGTSHEKITKEVYCRA